MSTRREQVTQLVLADETLEFVLAVVGWIKRASVASAGERFARLRLLNELRCNGPQKMSDLADSLGVTPRAITALVDGLEADDQVRRVAHPTDRRVTMVEISGDSAAVELQFEMLRGQIADLFDGVDVGDREAFARVTSELLSRLDGRATGPESTESQPAPQRGRPSARG